MNLHVIRNEMKGKLLTRRLVRIAVPILLSIMVPSAVFIWITIRSLRTQIAREVGTTLALTGDALSGLLSELEFLYDFLETNPDVHRFIRQLSNSETFTYVQNRVLTAVTGTLFAAQSARNQVDSIHVYAANDLGRFLSSSNGLVHIVDGKDAEWLSRYQQKIAYDIGSWTEHQRVESREFLTVYRTFSDGNGVIVVNFNYFFVRNLLKESLTYPGQEILVLDENGELLVATSDREQGALSADKLNYYIHEHPARPFGWTLISVVPKAMLYQPIRRMILISIAYSLTVLFVVSLIVIRSSAINARKVNSISNMLVAARQGETPEAPDLQASDEYYQIVHNLLQVFIERDYLQLQLSERFHRNRSTQLQALQYQINPHFLTNTLETMKWRLAESPENNPDILASVENLASILRYSLDDPNELVTLEEEIDHANSYLAILRDRYPERFEVVWDVQPDLCGELVMRMVLQPLLENAVYHGIKEKAGVSTLRITSRTHGTRIVLEVCDNGIGMTPERLAFARAALSDNAGPPLHPIGLRNTALRLRLLYGNAVSTSIESERGEGTRVVIALPAVPSSSALVRLREKKMIPF